ncbi:cytochrome c oxidase subunit NDUFA4-like [Photinus pyralis]|uniref:cytochrome c oxidase subunit NDUFA4-like n=1 Tax=Photinus pyralis TaxID=7054 RepID=UPI0012671EF2|nr:cytochrome c oxidase subunit NDUFA4-like [Photinus pyralis]XP_031332387.1 cytochrome c oxidase subunit NDUFA4-like [Photinus pyralis]XP_031332388.1 cytochrome c oxidase subunit NDUFA4-like [Photinus pyralis]XP_031333535.1 cytochrome c oxidase subunit NDUFA4-like [Photinus pyralis]XP_031333536.1 cytochrome c oxidase subunit NDUFA4-like [Photinus pyralis]XP_031333537.1 cytochrome c oxidase subunit NDUFA4-like [Photinus pyralis]
MQGLSLQSLKKHRALIPLYVCVGIGCAGAVGYTLRLALRNPDVAWANKGEGASNEDYRSKQYKFYSPNLDYSKLESPAPKY